MRSSTRRDVVLSIVPPGEALAVAGAVADAAGANGCAARSSPI